MTARLRRTTAAQSSRAGAPASPRSEAPVVVVTGASRGIGKAMVERFSARGYRVAACARSESVLGLEGAALAEICDVRDPRSVRSFIAKVRSRFGRIDVLVNNAGQAGSNPLDPAASDEVWHSILGTNLHGTYYLCKHALPLIPRGGRIINVASVLALKGVPDQTAYCAAKHGVLGFTRALAHQLAPRLITVNAICPGWVDTAMARGRMKELKLGRKRLEAGVPLGRMVTPGEVADFALYLASRDAAMVTGQALTIDGGSLA